LLLKVVYVRFVLTRKARNIRSSLQLKIGGLVILWQFTIQFPEFEAFQRKNLERHVVSLHKRILNQLQLTALERYNLFLEQYPNIEQHVPNYHIASYLGITQQSLSRIRAEIAKK